MQSAIYLYTQDISAPKLIGHSFIWQDTHQRHTRKILGQILTAVLTVKGNSKSLPRVT